MRFAQFRAKRGELIATLILMPCFLVFKNYKYEVL